jgi:integrase
MKTTKTKPETWPKSVKVGSATTKVYRMKHPRTVSGFIYVVSWHSAGRRLRQKFADPEAAMTEARLRATQISAGGIEASTVSKADRDELHAARRIAGDTPLLSVVQEWHRARELTGANVIPACEAWAARNSTAHDRAKVADVVTRYLAEKTKAGVSTAKNHAHIFEDMKRDFGGQFIDTINSRQLDQWIARWESPGTRDTFRKWTVALWRWAQAKKYLSREIKTEAEQTQPVRKDDMEIGIIGAATYAKLLTYFRAHHPDYLPALVLAGFCGMRRSEIHAQKWQDINLTAGHLRVTKGKRGTPSRRLVPLCPAAVEWLLLAPDRTEGLCYNLALDRIRNIARDAKYDLPENCFRHSFISHRVAQTGNLAETSLVAGNSPKIIQRHYLELVTKAEGETWFAITPGTAAEVVDIKTARG